MATPAALCRAAPSLGHYVRAESRGSTRRIQGVYDRYDYSSVAVSSVSSLPRCGCSGLGLSSFLSSAGVRQQQGNSLFYTSERIKLCGLRRKSRRRKMGLVTEAGMRLDPGGGGGDGEDGNGIGRVIVNLALAGGLTYLTVTGKLGWVFDTIISLWLLAVLLPIVGIIAFLWFAEREIVTGACPNCGESFQVFEFVVKEEPQLCPYCSQSFKLENGKFIRDEPRFSSRRANSGPFSGGFRSPFSGGFGRSTSTSSRKDDNQDPGGVIVDVEAEVRDRD